jgi:cytochrome bd-type quinol oxidase subunit 2
MKRRILSLISMVILVATMLLPLPALAANNVFQGPCETSAAKQSSICQNGQTKSNPLTGPNGLIVKITRIVAIIGGAAAVIIIIISGLRYILSDGDAKQTSEARSGILYAAVGLIIIVLAASIISWVMNEIYK